jgi:hypothetical protein
MKQRQKNFRGTLAIQFRDFCTKLTMPMLFFWRDLSTDVRITFLSLLEVVEPKIFQNFLTFGILKLFYDDRYRYREIKM